MEKFKSVHDSRSELLPRGSVQMVPYVVLWQAEEALHSRLDSVGRNLTHRPAQATAGEGTPDLPGPELTAPIRGTPRVVAHGDAGAATCGHLQGLHAQAGPYSVTDRMLPLNVHLRRCTSHHARPGRSSYPSASIPSRTQPTTNYQHKSATRFSSPSARRHHGPRWPRAGARMPDRPWARQSARWPGTAPCVRARWQGFSAGDNSIGGRA